MRIAYRTTLDDADEIARIVDAYGPITPLEVVRHFDPASRARVRGRVNTLLGGLAASGRIDQIDRALYDRHEIIPTKRYVRPVRGSE